ncbi:44488_t:CDS:2, partial [Gigaspora margarita]
MSQSRRKSAGRPPSDIWDSHFKKDKEVSKGHYEGTCNYYFEDHLANNCPNVSSDIQQKYLNKILERFGNPKNSLIKKNVQTKMIDFHESSKLSLERINEINKACVKAFVICGIPWSIIKNPFFIDFLKTLHPGYTPPSREVLSGHHLSQEIATVNLKIIQKLNFSKNLTIACDGWTNNLNESIWNFLIYTPDRCKYLWCLKNLSNESHTGVLIAEEIKKILE